MRSATANLSLWPKVKHAFLVCLKLIISNITIRPVCGSLSDVGPDVF